MVNAFVIAYEVTRRNGCQFLKKATVSVRKSQNNTLLVITALCVCGGGAPACLCIYIYGPGSSVGITTDYGLDGPGSNPGGDEIFSARPDRPWGPPSLLYD